MASKFEETFNDSDWLTLQFSPMWVFVGVAGVDGKISKKERKRFFKLLSHSPALRGDLVREVMMSVFMDLEGVFKAFSDDGREVQEGLPAVAGILEENVSKDEAVMFKTSLVSMGVEVASADGPIIGSNISDAEAAGLTWIQSWLDLDEAEASRVMKRYLKNGSQEDLPGNYL
jgi:tellurite resistance protein